MANVYYKFKEKLNKLFKLKKKQKNIQLYLFVNSLKLEAVVGSIICAGEPLLHSS
jgi:hypothetical protein